MVVGRSADIESHVILVMFRLDLFHPLCGIVERFFPACLFEPTVPLDQRRLQDVRIVMQFLDRIGLGTDISLAEGIVGITAYAHDRLRFRFDRDQGTAMGFAERSEEHTSELQSLMRISYAVFCL